MLSRMIRLAVVLAALFWPCGGWAAKPPNLPTPLGERFAVEITPAAEEISVISPIPRQGGLIGMIAGNMAVKRDEALVASFRDRLLKYDFNARMRAALESTLPSEGVSPQPWFLRVETPWTEQPDEAMAQAPRDALVLVPSYAFDPWFRGLDVQIDAYVVKRYLKNKGKRLETQIRFHRRYAFAYSNPLKGKDERIAYWQSAPTPALEKMLDHAIRQAAEMIAFDFSAEGRAHWGRNLRMTRFEANGREYSGRLLRRGQHWVWALGALQYSEQGSAHYWNFGITGDWPLPPDADWEAFLAQPIDVLDAPAPVDPSAG